MNNPVWIDDKGKIVEPEYCRDFLSRCYQQKTAYVKSIFPFFELIQQTGYHSAYTGQRGGYPLYGSVYFPIFYAVCHFHYIGTAYRKEYPTTDTQCSHSYGKGQ